MQRGTAWKWSAFVTIGLVVAAGACSDDVTDPIEPVNSAVASDFTLGDARQPTIEDRVAQGLAAALADTAIRRQLFEDLRDSPFRQHSLDLFKLPPWQSLCDPRPAARLSFVSASVDNRPRRSQAYPLGQTRWVSRSPELEWARTPLRDPGTYGPARRCRGTGGLWFRRFCQNRRSRSAVGTDVDCGTVPMVVRAGTGAAKGCCPQSLPPHSLDT